MQQPAILLLLTNLNSFNKSLLTLTANTLRATLSYKRASSPMPPVEAQRTLSLTKKAILTGMYDLHIPLTARYRQQLYAASLDVKASGFFTFCIPHKNASVRHTDNSALE
jgi:hypothetical protein